MTDIASLTLAVDTTQVDKGTISLEKLADAGTGAENSAIKLAASNGKLAGSYSGMNDAINRSTAGMFNASMEVQKILNKYDPLGTKLRSLEADFVALSKAASEGLTGSKNDAVLDKTYKALNDEIAKTKVLMEQAGAGTKVASGAMAELGLNNNFARRELLVLGHEAMNGNFSRIPGSFMALAGHSKILPALLNPITLGIFAIGAAAIGMAVAVEQGRKALDAMKNALVLTSGYAGMTRSDMDYLAKSMTEAGTITIGTSKEIVTALVASGQLGGGAIRSIAMMTSEYARATGQDIEKIAPEMVKLFADPLKGAEELNKSMHFLTSADLEHIDTLVQLGEKQQAQLYLADKVTDHLKLETEHVGLLTKAYRNLKDAISKDWESVGHVDSTQDLMQKKLAEINAVKALGGEIGKESGSLKRLEAEYKAMSDKYVLEQKSALLKDEEAKANEKDMLVRKELEKTDSYRVSQLQKTLDMLSAQTQTVQVMEREKQLVEQINQINDKKSKTETDAERLAKSHAKEAADAEARITILKAETAATVRLTEAQKKIIEVAAQGKYGVISKSESALQIKTLAPVADQEIASAAITKQVEQNKKITEGYLRETEALNKKNAAQEISDKMIGKTLEEQSAIQQQAIANEIVSLKETENTLAQTDAYTAQIAAIEGLITAKEKEKGNVATKYAAEIDKQNKAIEVKGEAAIADTLKPAMMGLVESMSGDWRDMTKAMSQKYQDQVISTMVDKASKFAALQIVNELKKSDSDMAKIMALFSIKVSDEAKSAEKEMENANLIVAVIMAIVTTAANQFASMSSDAARTMMKTVAINGNSSGASSGSHSELMQIDQTWFQGQKDWTVNTQLSTAQLNLYSAAIKDSRNVMIQAGNALGFANTAAKEFTISVNTAGDPVTALAKQIGQSLLPAIVLFQKEGETLTQTAQRLTDTFTATNNLLDAAGSSSQKAFGGFGLQTAAARDNLVAAAGGLSAFSASSSAYIKNFLTPAQQLQPALDAVAKTFNSLGISGISTNKQFSDLVQAQLDLGNTSVVGQLMTVADSFNTITSAAAATNAQLKALSETSFSTLADYQRAQSANAAATIAATQVTQAAQAAKDQAGTASFTSANSGAIAFANSASVVSTSGTTTTGNGTFVDMLNKIADIINEVWTKISDFFSHFLSIFWDGIQGIWTKISDFFSHFITAFWDGIQSIGQKIVDGISHAISSLGNGLGLGGTGSGLFGGGGFLGLGFANGGAFGGSNVHAFASGGSFTNGVYNTPTPFMFANGSGFSNGIMGEAGSEAVMPLKRGADGSLGVRMYGGAANDSSSGAVNLLRAEIIQMRKDNYAGQLAIATATQKMARLMDRWEGGGSPPLRAAL